MTPVTIIDVAALPDPTQLAIPAFVLLVLLEILYGRCTGRTRFEGRDTLTSLIMGLGSTLSGALTAALFFALAYWVWETFAVFTLQPTPMVFLGAFVLDDLAYYWKHRLGHRMRWMWAAHVIHHSSQHYNLSTALRQSWTGQFTPAFLLSLPLFILGIEPAIVFFCGGVNLVYQFWIHTESIGTLPRWFEAVFNTPSHHRVHHAKNPRYLDANYAGVLIIWDKLFGSFIAEDPTEPCDYGLVRDLGTFNPLRVAFHEWGSLARDLWSAPRWKDRFCYIFAPPGWSHDNSRLTSDMIKTRWGQVHSNKETGSDAAPHETA